MLVNALASEEEHPCFFCSLPADRILFASPDFVGVLCQGPLVEGHILIVPKMHVSSMINLSGNIRAELNAIMDIFRCLYRRVLFYEHGNHQSNTSELFHTHAHLQIVPIDVNINDLLLERHYVFMPGVYIKDVAIRNEYLYYETAYNNPGFYLLDPRPEEFFIRKLILTASNQSIALADWKIYPKTDLMERTRMKFLKLKMKF